MRLFNSRRGEAEFGLEQLVRLVMSFAIATVMLGLLISLVFMFMGSKVDKTAGNSLDNFVWLIEAQEGAEWKTATYMPLPKEFAFVGFPSDATQISVFERPASCVGHCLCIFEADYPDGENNKAVECKSIEYSPSGFVTSFPGTGRSMGFAMRGDYTKCMLLVLNQQNGALDITHHPICEQVNVAVAERQVEDVPLTVQIHSDPSLDPAN